MEWNWVHLETARFQMGSDRLRGAEVDDEGPPRLVTVGSFSITARPISHAQFAKFVLATGYVTTAEAEGTGLVLDESQPDGAWTEGANWRRPDGQKQSVEHEPVVQVSWFDCQEFCRWSGTQLPTEAQWERAHGGQQDVQELQAWQWCADYYHATFHRGEQRVNPTGPTAGNDRVLRGGSDIGTARHHELPDLTSNRIGFRVVRGRLWQGTPAELE